MKVSYQIVAAGFMVASLSIILIAQAGHSTYDPAAHVESAKPGDSFLDFTLKRINSSGTNYGQCLAEGRVLLIEETARNAYFWSNVVALGLLACLFIIVVYQHRIQTKREWTVAEMVAGLERSLALSRVQVEAATKKNRELTDALASLRESALRPASFARESAERESSPAAKPRATNANPAPPATQSGNSGKANAGSAARTGSTKESTDQMRLFTPDADFVMKLNSLEQQLAHSREDNRQLRRRIADGDRRLEGEQERNRQLKGA
jgi:hypothetical protein